ncbi:MAG: MFS transporter [Verrucomicrobiales bacterium]|nr:MFS transporter [Verrucomicrobiales bacterium]MCP5557818.1 MFS transporter [Verrucomicrobiaceae bacterium]
MSKAQRHLVLIASFLALVFDGVELGLMPVASLSVSKSLLGADFTNTLGGDWFARFTAALMLGAAVGGVALGGLGDRIGRTRAMGICILFYSVFAMLGAYARSQEQMLVLRFLVGLGVGGLWPNGIALVAECWPGASRPLVSGVMMAGLNVGILLLSQLARLWPITPDSWQWIFHFAGAPALLGIFVLTMLPESPKWLATRNTTARPSAPLRELFQPQLIRFTITGIALSTIPMVGAWSASKWMIPWADKVAAGIDAGYKAATQGWWALGAALGSFAGAQLAAKIGRRRSYLLISIATWAMTVVMFRWTAPLQPSFHSIVFIQGFVATLFFGWLALYLPELFPTRVRATGSGLAYNAGRFATAGGVLLVGVLFTALGGDYPRVGTICASIYALGIVAIWWAPKTQEQLGD